MTALANDRTTPKRTGHNLNHPVAAGAVIFAGALVCLNASGFAVKGSTSATLKASGMARARVDNTAGADGALRLEVDRHGLYQFANSAAGDAIALADMGSTAYIVDDQTVAKTNGGGTRSAAGKVVDVDAAGVWIQFT